MAELDPEEAAALAEAAGVADGDPAPRVAVVSLRDFSEPRTLSADRIAHIRKTLSSRIQSISNALAGPLRGHQNLTLGEVSEMNAHGLFDGFVRPFLVYGFDVEGTLGWLIWEADAARIACDTILAGPPDEDAVAPEKGDPMLTRTERRVVGSLLDELISRVAEGFGLTAAPGSVWQEPEELTTLQDLGPDADSRRLLVHLSFDEESGMGSDLRLYLPGVVDPEGDHELPDGDQAPAHLRGVDLELSAHLGGTDVPLQELLGIEVGDVIPLDSRVGDLADIEIEETICARARFGSNAGRMVIVIEEVDPDSPLPLQSE